MDFQKKTHKYQVLDSQMSWVPIHHTSEYQNTDACAGNRRWMFVGSPEVAAAETVSRLDVIAADPFELDFSSRESFPTTGRISASTIELDYEF